MKKIIKSLLIIGAIGTAVFFAISCVKEMISLDDLNFDNLLDGDFEGEI